MIESACTRKLNIVNGAEFSCFDNQLFQFEFENRVKGKQVRILCDLVTVIG